jgi:2-dehydro-3-deoxygalactonokinase
MPDAAEWIALDWGTSNLRAWAMGPDGAPVTEASSGAGMNTLARDGFEPALLDLVGPWLGPGGPTSIVACGMVGARQGWIEAPYVATPCAPLHAEAMVRAPAADPRLDVRIIPGVSQAAPPDVMRGEETQIAGFIASRPRFDGVLCLPGTHTKWVHVSAGEIVSFATFMTGEIFGLLATSSVLRHSVGSDEWSDADFGEAVGDAMARPERFASRLFGLRAASLLENLRPERARARLSGLLIGLELAGSRPYWLGREVALIGDPALARTYRAGRALCGLEAGLEDATAMTLAGLVAARSASPS